MEIGRVLFKLVFVPVLKTDLTLATLHMFGKTPFLREELKITATSFDKISAFVYAHWDVIVPCRFRAF